MALRYKKTHKQCGAVSLFISIILLIGITLVVFSTTKTVLMETKITADNYRTTQATAAAQAAMDRAVAFFMAGGLDQDGDAVVDYVNSALKPPTRLCQVPATIINTTAFSFTLVAAIQTTFSSFYFVNTPTYDHDLNAGTAEINNPCDSIPSSLTALNMTEGMIVAQGWSDDCSAVRTISQCVGTFESPKQPFDGRDVITDDLFLFTKTSTGAGAFLAGTGAIITGSWKDW